VTPSGDIYLFALFLIVGPDFLTRPQANYNEETGGYLDIQGCIVESILKISPWRLAWFMNGARISNEVNIL